MSRTKVNTETWPRPIGNRAIVRRDEIPQKIGNVLIPDQFHEGRKPVTATVLAVGPGKWKNGKRVPPDINVGDRVILKKYLMPGMEMEGKGLSGADVKNDKTQKEWFTLIQDIDAEILGILE
jgi:chaperonin GroES